jgi:hypothetical protein
MQMHLLSLVNGSLQVASPLTVLMLLLNEMRKQERSPPFMVPMIMTFGIMFFFALGEKLTPLVIAKPDPQLLQGADALGSMASSLTLGLAAILLFTNKHVPIPRVATWLTILGIVKGASDVVLHSEGAIRQIFEAIDVTMGVASIIMIGASVVVRSPTASLKIWGCLVALVWLTPQVVWYAPLDLFRALSETVMHMGCAGMGLVIVALIPTLPPAPPTPHRLRRDEKHRRQRLSDPHQNPRRQTVAGFFFA